MVGNIRIALRESEIIFKSSGGPRARLGESAVSFAISVKGIFFVSQCNQLLVCVLDRIPLRQVARINTSFGTLGLKSWLMFVEQVQE